MLCEECGLSCKVGTVIKEIIIQVGMGLYTELFGEINKH